MDKISLFFRRATRKITVYVKEKVITSYDVSQKHDFFRCTAYPLCNPLIAFTLRFSTNVCVKMAVEKLGTTKTMNAKLLYNSQTISYKHNLRLYSFIGRWKAEKRPAKNT